MKLKALAAAVMLAGGFSTTASAHFYNGTLGTSATATDKFYISCAAGTAKITYQIKRTVGTPNARTRSYSPAGAFTTSSGTSYSPLVTVTTSSGAKFFEVNKNPAASGAISYTLDMHCWDTNNLHNPDDQSPAVTYIQNQ